MPASIIGGTTTITITTITTTSNSSTKLCRRTGTFLRCRLLPPRPGTASAFSPTQEDPRSWAAAPPSCVQTLPAWALTPPRGQRARQGNMAGRLCPQWKQRRGPAKGKATAQVTAHACSCGAGPPGGGCWGSCAAGSRVPRRGRAWLGCPGPAPAADPAATLLSPPADSGLPGRSFPQNALWESPSSKQALLELRGGNKKEKSST